MKIYNPVLSKSCKQDLQAQFSRSANREEIITSIGRVRWCIWRMKKTEKGSNIRFPSSLAFTARSSFPTTTIRGPSARINLFRDRNRVIIRRKWERIGGRRELTSARLFSYRKTRCLGEFNRELCRNNSQCASGRNWRLLQNWGKEKKPHNS